MKDTSTPPTPCTITLRELPLATRLTLAVFLMSVGIGYVAALIQLHFQHASPGELLPTTDDAVRVFFGQTGEKPKSKLELLLPEDYEGKKMNGQGQMTSAFFKRADDYKEAIGDRAKQLAKQRAGNPKDDAIKEAAKAAVDEERHGERLAMIAWIREGASEACFNDDNFPLPDDLAKHPMTAKYLMDNGGKAVEPHAIKIKTLVQERCATCHGDGGEAQNFPLSTFADLKKYTTVKTASGMSMEKLAQSSHVHLLGFSLLYGLTGLILSFSSYPRLLRVLLCPLPLVAQVVDISFWWLARLPEPQGPMFARAIVVSGAVVAVGLLLHIVLSLFNLFSKKAWMILILLFGAAAYSAHEAKVHVIDPYIAQEKAPKAEAK
jgi:mono/diheme cytochrome c family protein